MFGVLSISIIVLNGLAILVKGELDNFRFEVPYKGVYDKPLIGLRLVD